MIGYVKHFDSSKTMSFKVSNNKLLKKYTKIWERVSKRQESVYGDNDKYIKTKIKMYEDRVNFQVKKCLKRMPHISAHR